MSLATHGKIAETHGLKTRILMLVAPLAALIYPFTLRGFNASVTTITSAGGNGGALPWITASASMAMRWTAAAMQEAAKGFRRLKAHKQLPALRAALEAHQTRNSTRGVLARQANAA
jgi:hypothetical protein